MGIMNAFKTIVRVFKLQIAKVSLDNTGFKEEIKANGIQGIFKVQPVIIIQPLKDSITQDRHSEQHSKENSKSFACILDEACQEQPEDLDFCVETYDKRAREVLYLYHNVRHFDLKQ